MAVKLGHAWICQGCGATKLEIWCLGCDIHWSGKSFVELREEKAVCDLDMVLSMALDSEKVLTA